MDIQTKVKLLIQYIKSLTDFSFVDYMDGNYCHMGATISDAILQAGTKYDTVVRPRIRKIREIYPEAKTTSAFMELLIKIGPKTILPWSDEEKPNRVVGLTKFFLREGLETEPDVSAWMENEENVKRILQVRGVGPKTADYIKILVGCQTAAVDRHSYTFLNRAGVQVSGYEEALNILNLTADSLKIDRALFDHSIWQYMSRQDKPKFKVPACKSG